MRHADTPRHIPEPLEQVRETMTDHAADPRATTGDERTQLAGFLDGQREILLRKVAGLGQADLNRTHPPSTLTLAGLLHHAALNEDWWFTVRAAGGAPPSPWDEADWDADPDWEMTTAADLEPEVLRQRYLDAIDRSRAVVAALADLDAEAPARSSSGEPFSHRWIILHMIEETARHAGHADLIRESIDGETGE
ncbi:MAG: DinB family protein [Lapillicoccus sp.]